MLSRVRAIVGLRVWNSIPSIELPSLTENFRPSSLIVTCALLETEMQRRSRNNWRAELETAVRTGASSSMSARVCLCMSFVYIARTRDGLVRDLVVVVVEVTKMVDA
jgi:hypothetical protein